MNKTQDSGIGKRLQRSRKLSGESQVILGLALGCASTTVSKYERGEMELYADAIRLICDRYQLNHTWFLTGMGEMYVEHSEKQQDFMSSLMNADAETVEQLKDLLKKLAQKL